MSKAQYFFNVSLSVYCLYELLDLADVDEHNFRKAISFKTGGRGCSISNSENV